MLSRPLGNANSQCNGPLSNHNSIRAIFCQDKAVSNYFVFSNCKNPLFFLEESEKQICFLGKMPTPAKKREPGDEKKYHFTIGQKMAMLEFDEKYCEKMNCPNISARKMARLIEKEFGWTVSGRVGNETDL